MIGVVAYGTFTSQIAWWILAILILFGLVAEVLEFFAVKVFSDRYGGSRPAFWAAIGGGIIGAFVGTPVPLIGSVIGALAGTFAGAALVTMHEQKRLAPAMRVGVGATLGRVAATAIKVTVAVIVLVVGMTALIIP
jgi:uncharacterized protein YqgC (DUF456 family)